MLPRQWPSPGRLAFYLLKAPRSGLRPARPPRGTRNLGAARRFLVSRPAHKPVAQALRHWAAR
jgi:hypothetical protein